MGAYQPLLSASLQSRAASPPALPHSLLSPTHAPPCSALSADKQQMAFADCPFRVHALDFNISAPSLQAMALEHIGLKLCDDFLDIGAGNEQHLVTVSLFASSGRAPRPADGRPPRRRRERLRPRHNGGRPAGRPAGLLHRH